ncbi:hypothetical protein LXL04_009410 [Taraxacum kok-saghyz]
MRTDPVTNPYRCAVRKLFCNLSLDNEISELKNFDFRAIPSLSGKYKIPIFELIKANVRDQVTRSHKQITQRLYTESILPKKTCCKNIKHPEVELNNKENPDLRTEVATETLEDFNLNHYHGFWLT